MNEKDYYVWDKEYEQAILVGPTWEKAARQAAQLNEKMEKIEKGKQY